MVPCTTTWSLTWRAVLCTFSQHVVVLFLCDCEVYVGTVFLFHAAALTLKPGVRREARSQSLL